MSRVSSAGATGEVVYTARQRQQLQQGVTLIELLIVLGMLGVIAGVMGWAGLGWLASSEAEEAASALSSALESARNEAVFKSKQSTVTINTTGDYTVNLAGQTQTYKLPNNVKPAQALTVTYSAPFGSVDAAADTITLKGRMSAKRNIYLVGVTGKVIVE